MKETVLIVEDNEAIRLIIEEFLFILLDMEAVNIISCPDVPHAEAALKEWNVAIVLTDLNLGSGPDGLSLIDTINQTSPRPIVAAMSSLAGLKPTEEYLRRGLIDFFLCKPFTLQDLRTVFEKAGAVALAPKGKRHLTAIQCQLIAAKDVKNSVQTQQ
jgi:DNA-binding NtrC family response regulator